jgi:hypothetical protein
MPTLNTPTLTLGAVDNDKRDVTVAGNVSFTAADIGKTFRLEIKVYGEDPSGDNLPAGDAVGDDLLYTYLWTTPFLPVAYKTFTVAAAGNVAYSEKRAIATATLDEDAGKVVIGMADIHTPVYSPRSDEVYARVSMSVAPGTVTKRSATVSAGFGV